MDAWSCKKINETVFHLCLINQTHSKGMLCSKSKFPWQLTPSVNEPLFLKWAWVTRPSWDSVTSFSKGLFLYFIFLDVELLTVNNIICSYSGAMNQVMLNTCGSIHKKHHSHDTFMLKCKYRFFRGVMSPCHGSPFVYLSISLSVYL